MKRFCEKSDKTPYILKDVFREAAVSGLISDPTRWFKFIEIREFSHDLENSEKVIAIFDDFSDALNELIQNLEKQCHS